MFLGTHTPRLDDKGRLALPARFRPELEAGLVITKGQERCLFVFPVTEFSRITEGLRTAPVTDRRVRDYSRVFFASASHEIPDGQGRITVPPAAARVRRADQGLRGDRCEHPRRGVGRGRLAEYLDRTEQAFADAEEVVCPECSDGPLTPTTSAPASPRRDRPFLGATSPAPSRSHGRRVGTRVDVPRRPRPDSSQTR